MAFLCGGTVPTNTTRAVFVWHKCVGGFVVAVKGQKPWENRAQGVAGWEWWGQDLRAAGEAQAHPVPDFDPLHPQLLYSLVSGCFCLQHV